jgi:ubiquinone/menaquinone biosynthesis C-methylase UbiE
MAIKQKAPKPFSKIRFAAQILMLIMPGRAQTRVSCYYWTFFDLFSILSEDKGFLNIGYAEDSENVDLLTAQKTLVRRTTRDLATQGRWLDVGCGTGEPARLLAEDHERLTITGIDILKHKDQGPSESGGRVDIRYGDAVCMPIEDTTFDGVYAIETAFHYPDKDAFVREAFRVLVPGGRFAVADIVWRHRRIPLLHTPRTWLWRNLMASPQIFTENQWRLSLAAAGFSNIGVEDISRQTFGLYSMWVDQAEKHRQELSEFYPGWVIDIGIAFFNKIFRCLPFRYILVTGEKEKEDCRAKSIKEMR